MCTCTTVIYVSRKAHWWKKSTLVAFRKWVCVVFIFISTAYCANCIWKVKELISCCGWRLIQRPPHLWIRELGTLLDFSQRDHVFRHTERTTDNRNTSRGALWLYRLLKYCRCPCILSTCWWFVVLWSTTGLGPTSPWAFPVTLAATSRHLFSFSLQLTAVKKADWLGKDSLPFRFRDLTVPCNLISLRGRGCRTVVPWLLCPNLLVQSSFRALFG